MSSNYTGGANAIYIYINIYIYIYIYIVHTIPNRTNIELLTCRLARVHLNLKLFKYIG